MKTYLKVVLSLYLLLMATLVCRAQKPELVVQTGHSLSWVRDVAYSPDERYVVTCGDDKTARLWETATGNEVRRFTEQEAVEAVAFSPDGKYILTKNGEVTICLWSVSTGKIVRQFTRQSGEDSGFTIKCLAFSHDGNYVAAAEEGDTLQTGIVIWSTFTGKVKKWLPQPIAPNTLTFSSNDQSLVIGGDNAEGGDVSSWSLKTGKRQWRHQLPVAVHDVALSSSGNTILVGGSGFPLMNKDGQTLNPRAAGFNDYGEARMLETTTGRSLKKFGLSRTYVTSVTMSRDNRYILTSSARTALLWDAKTGSKVRQFKNLTDGDSPIYFSKDSRHFLMGAGHGANIWDIKTGKVTQQFTTRATYILSANWGVNDQSLHVVSPEYFVSMQAGAATEVRPTKLVDLIGGIDLIRGDAYDFVFSQNGHRVLVIDSELKVHYADLLSKAKFVFPESVGKIHKTDLSLDGKYALLSGDSRTVRLWDLDNRREVRQFEVAEVANAPSQDKNDSVKPVRAAFFTTNGNHIVTETRQGIVQMWEAGSGKILWQVPEGPDILWEQRISSSQDGRYLLMVTGAMVEVLNAQSRQQLWAVSRDKENVWRQVTSTNFSPDGNFILTGGYDGTLHLWESRTGEKVRDFPLSFGELVKVTFSPSGKFIMAQSADGAIHIVDRESGKVLCSIFTLKDGAWAVVSPDGRYDASNAGDVKGLHWVLNNESFDLKQFKERYYEPGLLSKLLGFNKDPLRTVSALQDVKLFPDVQSSTVGADGKLKLNLLNRGGGIGRVQVFVNGKELVADARGAKPNPQAKQATLNIDISNAPSLQAGKPNTVRVVTWNSEGYLSSRGFTLTYSPKTAAQSYKPEMWAIIGGTSEYSSPQLSLSYPSKDAEDMAKSFSLGAKRLFGADKVHLTILSSSKNAGTVLPTKANFRKAFEAARKARPGDILIIYLAGHGVALSQNNSTYCYLTQEARSSDTAVLSDPAVRDATTISSEELTEWVKKIPALKQVMILDTCAAGAAAKKLTEKRDISGDAVRAMERLKDRTGFFVLMGCASDAPSYEASQYQQGILTYSLLQGMKGAALRDSSFVDVSKLFQYAADQVPQLARGIGGIQKPQIASPGGTSFDIGELQASDKAAIPLAIARPLVLRPLLINPEEVGDNLHLSTLLAKKLRDQSYAASRGDLSSSVYIDADELPGAIQPKGTYAVEGNKVVVHLALWRDDKKIDSLQVEGDSNDLPALVTKMADAINAALQKIPADSQGTDSQ